MKKKLTALLMAAAMLCSCAATGSAATETEETVIVLSDSRITVDGQTASTDPGAAVYTGGAIIYYPEGTDASYGEGTDSEKHSAAEAAAHTVVTITRPGVYRISGSLSLGQIFVDLGEGAEDDPDAVVTLVLDGAAITCTVAPAVFFYRVYECGSTDLETAGPVVNTADAGANVVIAAGSENTITGSHVARIYKEGTTKKLHKYDAAFYSRMSMNINGDKGDDSGVPNIAADNEGLDSELHLTVNGGTINIRVQDDGINTNEDFVSVTTINGGTLTINAGLGSEGDGIDSNGYLTINGGVIWTMSNPTSPDGGIDADSPILINGGTLMAFGTRNDAADSASAQPYMELSFSSTLPAGSVIAVNAGETVLFELTTQKACQSVTLSGAELALGAAYQVYVDGVLQCYSGNRSGMMGGGMGGRTPEDEGAFGMPPGGEDLDRRGERPQDLPEGQMPEGFDPSQTPGDFDPGQAGQSPEAFENGGGPAMDGQPADGSGETDFILTETVKTFSGVCDSDASGKTRVSFRVTGPARTGNAAVIEAITAVTPSVEGLADSQIQITVTDDPSEDYAETCLLSQGLEAVNALLPTADGSYILTVAVAAGTEGYTGATQISFTVGALPFRDVSAGDDGYDAIRFVYEKGYMVGTSGDAFSPDGTVTRSQAVAVLARMAGAEGADSGLFDDVASGSWYSGYVGWAADNAIAAGDGTGSFLPGQAVTAAEMEQMLARYAALIGVAYDDAVAGDQPLTRRELAERLHNFALAQ